MTLGVPVERAVITVPAFFDENQRQATRHAGELAGLRVERIINEPTAATLAYHVHEDRTINVVVYDFGGGTFDVSIARMESGVIEVISIRGDTTLGGDDLDRALMNHVADLFQSEHDIDLREDTSTRWRLLHACESAKRVLSTEETVTLSEEFIAEKDGHPLHLSLAVSRAEYEALIDDSEAKPTWRPRQRVDAPQGVADPNATSRDGASKELALIAKAIRVADSAGEDDAAIDAVVQEIEDVIFYVEQ
ncbi:Hsp70 family protein [Rhodopirellula sp. JC639]|uniref:Hsp70 family protein n=1 Tax=Stieleria mannarensis TaxID=2755585 RepID=UPI002570292F|nr:Hsp70 family protein [Rhodopirellula sp. JC639]